MALRAAMRLSRDMGGGRASRECGDMKLADRRADPNFAHRCSSGCISPVKLAAPSRFCGKTTTNVKNWQNMADPLPKPSHNKATYAFFSNKRSSWPLMLQVAWQKYPDKIRLKSGRIPWQNPADTRKKCVTLRSAAQLGPAHPTWVLIPSIFSAQELSKADP